MTSVSVCMATHNGERFLTEQVDSILPQLGPGDELVISDDASSDGTLELLAGYKDPRLRVLSGNAFSSPVYNLENALQAAQGELLVLADQDDVWYPGRLARIRELLEERRSEVAAVMLDGDLVDAAGRPTGRTLFATFRASRGVLRNLVWNCYTGCAMAITRPLLELALPFPPGIPMHDSWLGLLAELRGEMLLVPECTFAYRRHGGNVSGFRWRPWQQLRWRAALIRQLLRRLRRRPVPPPGGFPS